MRRAKKMPVFFEKDVHVVFKGVERVKQQDASGTQQSGNIADVFMELDAD